ncbi:MAG TPA: hypothetical protein VHV55_11560 [Pirellulales bacterium]|jgi:hypothetical protein|nr:hypothetical protein [Pirellulales bacterium]
MGGRAETAPLAVGFLTVVEHEPHGLFGGFLVLDTRGRPLEFHCTAPVKTNRAQEILFGPTLTSYLYGEQIGQTLFAAARQRPVLACIDSGPMLAMRGHVDVPVVLIEAAESAAATGPVPQLRVDAAHPRGPRLVSFGLGRHRLALDADYAGEQAAVVAQLEPLAARWDLSEPFARIREAIGEAQRSGR